MDAALNHKLDASSSSSNCDHTHGNAMVLPAQSPQNLPQKMRPVTNHMSYLRNLMCLLVCASKCPEFLQETGAFSQSEVKQSTVYQSQVKQRPVTLNSDFEQLYRAPSGSGAAASSEQSLWSSWFERPVALEKLFRAPSGSRAAV